MQPKVRRRRLNEYMPIDGPARHAVDTLMIIVGAFITALSFNLFLLPAHIASGGVSGISIIVNYMVDINPAYIQWALNIPIFIAGWFLLGKEYSIRSLLGIIILPLFILLTQNWATPTTDPLLASLYGGIGLGLGLGTVFRGRGSTGGLSTVEQIFQKFSGLSLSTCVVIIDGAVILSAGFLLSWEKALYALIGLYITGKIIDAVELGFAYTKVAYIIADKPEEIARAVLNQMDRGLTKLDGKGGYTGDDRTVLMIVVNQSEVTRLKTIVQVIDSNAFVIISNAHEVVGKGFKQQG